MGAEAILAHWLLEQPQFLDDPLVELWEIVQCFVNEKKMKEKKWAGIPNKTLERERVLNVFTVSMTSIDCNKTLYERRMQTERVRGKFTKRCLGISINACVFAKSWLAYVVES